jgi:hypothetical protein
MANRPQLVATTFNDYIGGEVSYGFRLADDYDNTYSNTFDESVLYVSDAELLRHAAESFEDSDLVGYHILQTAESAGITINGKYYDANEVEEMLESV